MSKKHEHFPGATAADSSSSKGEKCDLTESSQVESGYISGSMSVEIDSREQQPPIEPQKTTTQTKHPFSEVTSSDSGVVLDSSKSGTMHLDTLTSQPSLEEKLKRLSMHDSGVYSKDLNTSKSSSPGQPLVESSCTKLSAPFKQEDLFKQDEDGDTQLHLAIAFGWIKIALALIRAAPCAAWLDTKNDRSQSPLHLAVEYGHYNIARWLIIAGAKPSPRDGQGDSPLHIASRLGHIECVKAITEPINPAHRNVMALSYAQTAYKKPCLDQWNYIGQTSIHVAADSGHLNILKHLVSCGADINAREGLQGLSALHYAVLNKDQHMISYIKQLKHANYYIVNYGGCNALQYAYNVDEQVTKSHYPILRDLESPYSSEEEDESSDEEMPQNFRPLIPGMSQIPAQ